MVRLWLRHRWHTVSNIVFLVTLALLFRQCKPPPASGVDKTAMVRLWLRHRWHTVSNIVFLATLALLFRQCKPPPASATTATATPAAAPATTEVPEFDRKTAMVRLWLHHRWHTVSNVVFLVTLALLFRQCKPPPLNPLCRCKPPPASATTATAT